MSAFQTLNQINQSLGNEFSILVVEGYFRPQGFQSLIPLPQAVQPETCFAQIQPYGLIIEVTKEGKRE